MKNIKITKDKNIIKAKANIKWIEGKIDDHSKLTTTELNAWLLNELVKARKVLQLLEAK